MDVILSASALPAADAQTTPLTPNS